MHNQPIRPLDDLETLRAHLRALLSEETIVKAAVEQIFQYGIESARLTSLDNFGEAGYQDRCSEALCKALEAGNITIRDDENSEEIAHVWYHDTHWLTFHISEWAWQNSDGTWTWEQADTEHKDDQAWEAHMRDGI